MIFFVDAVKTVAVELHLCIAVTVDAPAHTEVSKLVHFILFLNFAMVVNIYGISVGIAVIGWKLYIIYIACICVELGKQVPSPMVYAASY